MMSHLNNDYDVTNSFAKFEKFLPHRMIIPSFMTVRGHMPELDREAFPPPPPKKKDIQNTPYNLGLSPSDKVTYIDLNVWEITVNSWKRSSENPIVS